MTTPVEGLVGVNPQIIYIDTSDTNAIVTAAGYLNSSVSQGFTYNAKQIALVNTTDDGPQFYQITLAAATGIITLVADVNPGNVLLPVAVNRIASFTNVAGQIGDVTAAISHRGNIVAGVNNVAAGSFVAIPAGNNQGSLIITPVANGGGFNTIISNTAIGQSATYSLPDPGGAATSFLITNSAGTQTIATGSLALTLGNLTVAAGNIAATLGSITAGTTLTAGTGITSTTGNITASAGNVVAGAVTPAGGNFQSFPVASGGANDKFVFSAVTTGGNFTTTISNTTQGQTSVITVPDPGAATAKFLLDSGTANLVTDYSQMIPIDQFMLAAGGGAFTLVRTAQGNWTQTHATAADTSVYAFDVTEQLRAAAGKGFELTSYDLIYSIATLALVAHSTVLSTTIYANNVAVAVTTPAITSTLATATQANPYVTNSTVNVPAFSNPAAGTAVKQVIEVSVQAAATSVYNVLGINLRFTKSIS